MTDQILGRTTVDLSHMSVEDLRLFKRHLVAVVGMVDKLIGDPPTFKNAKDRFHDKKRLDNL
jgi:hypothetical protein